MNAKKVLKAAFKSVPEKYVVEESRIWIKGSDRTVKGRFAVLITHPDFDTIIWTEEAGWEKLFEDT